MNQNLTYKTRDWDKKWRVDFSAEKTKLVSFDDSNNCDAIDMKIDRSVLAENQFLRRWDWRFLLNRIGALLPSLL